MVERGEEVGRVEEGRGDEVGRLEEGRGEEVGRVGEERKEEREQCQRTVSIVRRLA